MIPASVISRLATLGLSEAQASGVASMLAEVETATEQKVGAELEAKTASNRASRKERNRRYYETHRKTNPVVLRRLKTHSDANGGSRAGVLYGEDSKSITPSVPSAPLPPEGADEPKKQKSQNRGARLPDDWQPKPEHLELALSHGLGRDRFNRAVDEFRDYWRGVPGTRGTKLDWDATFRNRLRDIAGREVRSNARAGPREDGLTKVLNELNGSPNGSANHHNIRDITPANPSEPRGRESASRLHEPSRNPPRGEVLNLRPTGADTYGQTAAYGETWRVG